MAFIHGKTADTTWVNIKTIRSTVKEWKLGQMVQYSKVNILRVSKKVKAFSPGLIRARTKETSFRAI